jgi:hypothetical protein
MHPVAGSTLLMTHALIFTIPQRITIHKTIEVQYLIPEDTLGKLTMLTMTQE